MTGAQKCSMLNAVSPVVLCCVIVVGTVHFGLASITLIATDHSASWLMSLGLLKFGMAVRLVLVSSACIGSIGASVTGCFVICGAPSPNVWSGFASIASLSLSFVSKQYFPVLSSGTSFTLFDVFSCFLSFLTCCRCSLGVEDNGSDTPSEVLNNGSDAPSEVLKGPPSEIGGSFWTCVGISPGVFFLVSLLWTLGVFRIFVG